MANAKFTPEESFNITRNFLRACEVSFREEINGGLGDLGRFADKMFADRDALFHDWEKCYKIAFGKLPDKAELVNQEKVFTCMLELISFYKYGLEFDLGNVLGHLYLIRTKPDEHKGEWELWQRVLDQQHLEQ